MIEELFGDKEQFAIEIKIADQVGKSKLRVWIKGTPLGYFKRKGSLTYSIRSLKKLLLNREHLYEPACKDKTPEAFYEWIVAKELVDNPTAENQAEFKRRGAYVVFWGDQLDEFSTTCYFKDAMFSWIINEVKRKRIVLFTSAESDVVPVLEAYITWYEHNYGELSLRSASL